MKVLSGLTNFALFAMFLTDYIVFWHTKQLGIRFSSFLRPLWLIFIQKDVHKTLKSIFLSFHKVIDIFLIFIAMCLLWGYMAYNLFSEYQA